MTSSVKTGLLIDYAVELGAARARTIAAKDIIVKDEVVAEWCGDCPEYGRNLMCPPFVPVPEDFRKVLSLYSRGIMLQLFYPLPDDPGQVNREQAFAGARRLHLAVYSIERRARELGFDRALGLTAGSCRLCASCAGPEGGCRDPEKARSSMEANGVSVVETCSKAGWPLEFPVKENICWTGLILLD